MPWRSRTAQRTAAPRRALRRAASLLLAAAALLATSCAGSARTDIALVPTTTTTAVTTTTTIRPATSTSSVVTTSLPGSGVPIECSGDRLLADARAAADEAGASGTIERLVEIDCEPGWAGACAWHSITEDTDCYAVFRWTGDHWEVVAGWDVCPPTLIALGAPPDVAQRLARSCPDEDPTLPTDIGTLELTCDDAQRDANRLERFFTDAFAGWEVWPDAPDFDAVSRNALDELVARCGLGHAMDTIGWMDVDWETLRRFVETVQAA